MKVKDVIFFSNSKETSIDDFLEICEEKGFEPTDEAIKNAAYAGYEIGINVEWDLETGDCTFISMK